VRTDGCDCVTDGRDRVGDRRVFSQETGVCAFDGRGSLRDVRDCVVDGRVFALKLPSAST